MELCHKLNTVRQSLSTRPKDRADRAGPWQSSIQAAEMMPLSQYNKLPDPSACQASHLSGCGMPMQQRAQQQPHAVPRRAVHAVAGPGPGSAASQLDPYSRYMSVGRRRILSWAAGGSIGSRGESSSSSSGGGDGGSRINSSAQPESGAAAAAGAAASPTLPAAAPLSVGLSDEQLKRLGSRNW